MFYFLNTILLVFFLTGCVTTQKVGGSDYRTNEVRQSGELFFGKILEVRKVKISNSKSDSLQK